MKRAILWHSLAAGGVGIPGAFAAHGDLVAITAIGVTLFIQLAVKAGKQMDKATATKIVAGVLAGIGGFAGGVKLANTYFAYTGVGTVPAIVVNAGANAGLTYLFGKAVASTFLAENTEITVEALVRNIILIITGKGGGPDDGTMT